MHIPPEHLEEVKRILAFWAPRLPAYAFGSRVHGRTLKRTSDLDICFKGDAPVPKKVMRQVTNAFDVSDIPFRVDIVDWHDLSQDFRANIEADLTRLSHETVDAAG